MVGPSQLGTLLIQRLDAVLGVPQSQQTNLATGARPDAVRQPDSTARPDQVKQDLGRHPRESVDKARSQGEQGIQRTIQQGKLDVQQRLLGASTSHSSTPSAPTTLGAAARTILALLSLFPDSAPPLAGRSPLLTAGGLPAGGSGTGSNPV